MEYAKIRDKIVTGDLFFTAHTGLLSKSIRFTTRSTISHVGVFVWLEGRLFTIEATIHAGIVLKLASERFSGKFYIGSTGVLKCYDKIKYEALDQLGTKYDLIGMLLAPFVDTKSEQKFCSEFVVDLLDLNMRHLTRGIFPSDVATACGGLVEVRV